MTATRAFGFIVGMMGGAISEETNDTAIEAAVMMMRLGEDIVAKMCIWGISASRGAPFT